MPEKTIETNNATTPKPPEKVEETTRRYMREAESTARDTVRMWNELITTSTTYYFDTFGKSMRYGIEMNREIGESWEHLMTGWRKMYMDNYKGWEGYWENINKMVTRPK